MKFKAIFFDCDGVLTAEGWHKLDSLMIPAKLDKKWKNEFNENRLTLENWVKNVTIIYRKKKLDRNLISRIYENIKINPEAPDLFAYLRKKKIKTAIISSGFKYYVEPVAVKLGADFWRANTSIIFDENDIFKKFESLIDDDHLAKVLPMNNICKDLNISLEETMFVGDSFNDIDAFELTKHGVIYQMREFETDTKDLEKYAWKKIKHLSEIKKLID